MQTVYIILSTLGLAAFVAAALIKGEEIKKNLFFVFTGSMLVGISYLFTPLGINGAVSSFVGGVQAITNYFFAAKKKSIPIWLVVIYAALFIGMNIAVLNSPIGVLALMASMCFVGSICVKTGKGYRLWQIANSLLWIGYDFLSSSYGPLVTHSVLFCFTVVGMLINDMKGKENK